MDFLGLRRFACICAVMFIAFIWFQEDRISETGKEAEVRESTLSAHSCFLIKSMSQREEHIRDVAVNLLTQIRDRFPQVNYASNKFLLISLCNFTCLVKIQSIQQHLCRFCGTHHVLIPCCSQCIMILLLLL